MNREEMIEKVTKYCREINTLKCETECIIDKEMGCFVTYKGTDGQLERACELIDSEKVFTPSTEQMILDTFLKDSRR